MGLRTNTQTKYTTQHNIQKLHTKQEFVSTPLIHTHTHMQVNLQRLYTFSGQNYVLYYMHCTTVVSWRHSYRDQSATEHQRRHGGHGIAHWSWNLNGHVMSDAKSGREINATVADSSRLVSTQHEETCGVSPGIPFSESGLDMKCVLGDFLPSHAVGCTTCFHCVSNVVYSICTQIFIS